MHDSTVLAGADLILFAGVLTHLRRCVASRVRQRLRVAGLEPIGSKPARPPLFSRLGMRPRTRPRLNEDFFWRLALAAEGSPGDLAAPMVATGGYKPSSTNNSGSHPHAKDRSMASSAQR